ncbi:hypothetical protein [Prevotella sp. OH937_COT-195]|uniref:hypothetical protein n=1 Tax=Prevotella sp. OH937_COT-195 TaxID=2491051 RepID=UPI000F651056|nr:hypothetical protein [Prevotella sp. OH937_COT-195]RRD00265.1 hypothetical protein EII32_07080 [Prevotella sp. OH937_COT-195]
MPLSLRFPTALARLLTSARPLHLNAARYAFDETAAHLLNNRTKSVEGYNDRFGLKIDSLVGKVSRTAFCFLVNLAHVSTENTDGNE